MIPRYVPKVPRRSFDPGGFDRQIAIHELYSTNRYGYFRWLFDLLGPPSQARILDVGAGPGTLWQRNESRISADWAITLSDINDGMVKHTRDALTRVLVFPNFDFVACDVQRLPFQDEQFDWAVANNMLYLTEDLDLALGEIHRVLRQGGKLLAATLSISPLIELSNLIRSCGGAMARTLAQERFCLENGQEQMTGYFEDVRLSRYLDALDIGDSNAAFEFLATSSVRPSLSFRERLWAHIQHIISTEGSLIIPKESAAFVATKT